MKEKVRIIKSFMDKYIIGKDYHVGDIVEFDQERIKDLLSKGLIEKIKSKESDTKNSKIFEEPKDGKSER